MGSLWGEEFEVAKKPEKIKKIIEKVQKPKAVSAVKKVTTKNSSIEDVLAHVRSEVYRILGKYAENTVCIRSYDEFVSYIDRAILNGSIAVDTETNNSLEPITCKLMGLCLYTPGMKNAYIPVNHVNRQNNELLDGQITEQQIHEQLQRLNDNKTFIIMHNGKFDYQVIKCTCDVLCLPNWDTMLAARILDENEKASLKAQYPLHIDTSQEKYDIENLFEKLQYSIVDPELFALYAATDSYMTYKLYEWQKKQFELLGNDRLYWVFKNIEMPALEVVAEMELTGVKIDHVYAGRLSAKYHKQLDVLNEKIAEELKNLESVIDKWRLTDEANVKPLSSKPNKNGEYTYQKSKSEQLSSPPQVTSPTQLAILFYDVLKVPVVDKKSPRGTGEDILKKIQEKNPDLGICKLILEKRGLEKLIGTYIDKIPQCVTEKDGRLHAHFNQCAAGTGRMSSDSPNLQNIPSKNYEIRLMFTAPKGMSYVGADFSQQEPRLLTAYCQDPNMLSAYQNGKDLYATMGTGVYRNDYWDNMEHHEDGSPNPDGAKRRKAMKVLMLGVSYGMGANSIAESLGITGKEAQDILDNFYKGFPKVKEWQTSTIENAKKTGYVEDFWGRRRRLPNIQLPLYQVIDPNARSDFNPLLGTSGTRDDKENEEIKSIVENLTSARGYRERDSIRKAAESKGYIVHDNGGYVSTAERESINARVQGGAASMTKIAMRHVYDNQELKNLGFKLILQIHDEVIGECPTENAERCSEILSMEMRESVKEWINVPFKSDGTITSRWYEDEAQNHIVNDFQKYQGGDSKKGISPMSYEEALSKIINEHTEFTVDEMYNMLGITA